MKKRKIKIPVGKGVCLDTNVFIRFLSLDESDDAATNLFRFLERNHFLIYGPGVLQFEIAKTLTKKERARLMTRDQAREGVDQFYQMPVMLVWNQELILEAMDLQNAGIKTLFDASFLALAKKRNLPLITEDGELLKKGKALYPAVYSIDEWLSRK